MEDDYSEARGSIISSIQDPDQLHFIYYFSYMSKILILILSTLLIVSCSVATAPSNSSNSGAVNSTKMIDAPTYGSGKHTIEYFGDFQCPACIRFSHSFLPILEEFA